MEEEAPGGGHQGQLPPRDPLSPPHVAGQCGATKAGPGNWSRGSFEAGPAVGPSLVCLDSHIRSAG